MLLCEMTCSFLGCWFRMDCLTENASVLTLAAADNHVCVVLQLLCFSAEIVINDSKITALLHY